MPEIFYWAPDAACMWIPCKLDPSCHSMDLDNKATEVKVNPVIDKQFSLPTQSTKPISIKIGSLLPMEDKYAMSDSPEDFISLTEVNQATILHASSLRFKNKLNRVFK